MPSTYPTKHGTRRLSDVTKHLVLPSGILTTGYPTVARQCRRMGVVYDDWQEGLARAVLAKRKGGLYAAGIGGVYLSTCRQIGKTFTVGSLVFALCVQYPGLTVLWTAHHTRTSDETYLQLSGFAQRPRVAPFVLKTPSGNGRQSIVFRNGSRILLGARERGFGRGVPGVAMVVFDEAQILSLAAVADMVPAGNTVRNMLVLYMGTPPAPKDPAELFKARRRELLSAERLRQAGQDVQIDGLWVEIGADDGADVDDRDQQQRGNPSVPTRTGWDAMKRLREQLADDDAFRREGMGVWDSDQAGTRLITAKQWEDTAVKEVADNDGLRAFGVAFSKDGGGR